MSRVTPIGQELGLLAPEFRSRVDPEIAPAVDDETAEREAVLAEADLAREKFPVRFRDAATDHPVILEWVGQFHADPTTAPGLLLLGPTGTGKTHAAYGAVAAAVKVTRRNRAGIYRLPSWRALTHADLCASLRPRGRDHDPEAELEKYRRYELLMVDDLGAAKSTEFVEEATYRLVNGRYEDMRPSIFTSNLAPPDLREAVGDRIASRLVETCVRVVLDGPDRRRAAKAE